jgi:hypothetical protein
MTPGYGSFIDAFETWLDEAPGEEDAESVLARIVAELDATPQRHNPWPRWLRLEPGAVLGFGLGVVATLIATLAGIQLIGGTGVGGPALLPPLPSAVSPSPSAALVSPNPRLVEFFPECPPYVPAALGTRPAAPTERGLIGLPPVDSRPSVPEVGRLVDCWPVNGGMLPYVGMARLYADGRLIWNYFFGEGNSRSTGHIEQRLTLEGVELVRGLDDLAEKDPFRLGDWLPSTAWEDRTIRPYVPARYGACLLADDGTETMGSNLDLTLTEKLGMLPPEVSELLRDREPAPTAPGTYGDPFDCLSLTTAEARRLDAALRDAGFDQDEGRNNALLEYHLDLDGDGPGTTTIAIWFEPVFPDGVIGCSSCG